MEGHDAEKMTGHGDSADAEQQRVEYDQSKDENLFSRLASKRSATSSVGPPPDGGLHAWSQVLFAHFTNMNTWGFINSFGVLQTYYEDTLGRSGSDIAWIGSLQVFLIFFVGAFSGRALDAGLFKHTMAVGMVFQVLGVFMTSLCKSYWQVLLANGVCVGIGNGLMFCPVVGLMSTYFSKHKSMAMALAACGSATGGLIYPAMIRELLPKIGFAWAIRTVAFVMLALNVVSIVFLRTRVPPRKAGPLVDWYAFKDWTYTLVITGSFFVFLALYFAFFFVGTYATNIDGFSYTDSTNLILVINGLGIISRIVPAFVADRYTGPLNMLIPVSIATAALAYAWYGVRSTGSLYAFTALYGVIANGIQSLFPTTIGTLTKDPKRAGTRIGMAFSIIAFAALIGPPIAGVLINADDGGYLYATMWAGSMVLAGAGVLIAARFASVRFRLQRI